MFTFDRNQFVGDFRTEKRADASCPTVATWQVVDHSIVVLEFQLNMRISQRDASKRFGNVPHLCRNRSHEFATDRCVVKQLADRHRRPKRLRAGSKRFYRAAVDDQFESGVLVGRAAANDRLTDRRDRCQRFAAKSEGAHRKQLVSVGDFTGGVTGYCQLQLFVRNAAAVVHQRDRFGAPFFDEDFDLVST